MGLFYRSTRSNSSSSSSSISETYTPRTSLDSTISSPSLQIIKSLTTPPPPPPQPLLTLPLELIQHISTYLNPAATASFSLTSRYTYYALGTSALSTYVTSSKNRFEKRRRIESVVERAFPGNWFCAWCDGFHAWSEEDTGPLVLDSGKRGCGVFNGYLSASSQQEEEEGEYKLQYQHIRLVINAAQRGPEHGIPLGHFSHESKRMALFSRTRIPTHLRLSAKISNQGNFLLHTHFALILPFHLTSSTHFLDHLTRILPPILSGNTGHTGLLAAIEHAVRQPGQKDPGTHACEECRCDWSISTMVFRHATGDQMRLVIRSWRDLGEGRSPFEGVWRAHCVCGRQQPGAKFFGNKMGGGGRVGDVRRAFEDKGVEGRGLLGRNIGDEEAEMFGIARARALPRWWLSSEENELVRRREVEERVDRARDAAEESIRLAVEGERRW